MTGVRRGRVHNHTGYDVTGYFRLAIIEGQKRSKMPPATTSVGISRERFKQGSRNLSNLSGSTGCANVLDMTSVAVSGRLRNAVKYCTKVRKKSVAGIEVHNLVTVRGRIANNDTLNLTERLPRL